MRLPSFWAFHCLHSRVVWMTVCASYVCLLICFCIYLYEAWTGKSGNVTAVTDPGATDCDTPGQRHSPQLRHWDTAHATQLQDPTPDKALWPVSHISFMSSCGTMTDLGTLVPNLRVPGSQLFQSSPSYLKTSKASFCTRLKLLLLLLVCRRLKLLH